MKTARTRDAESGSQTGGLAGLWADWGWRSPPRDSPGARRSEQRWRWPTMLALFLTIPAFYAELLDATPSSLAWLAYVISAMVLATALWRVSCHTHQPLRHASQNPSDLLLIAGLLLAATLPSSLDSAVALALRLLVALLTLLRMVWTLRSLFTRGGLSHMLISALGVLVACGLGFWWLEPTTPNLGSGLWLAFTTATTVGYGDTVPTTLASKVFAVFVVLLGYGVLSLVTAAIASSWVETEEQQREREFLREMHREIAGLRQELAALRKALAASAGPREALPTAPAGATGLEEGHQK